MNNISVIYLGKTIVYFYKNAVILQTENTVNGKNRIKTLKLTIEQLTQYQRQGYSYQRIAEEIV